MPGLLEFKPCSVNLKPAFLIRKPDSLKLEPASLKLAPGSLKLETGPRVPRNFWRAWAGVRARAINFLGPSRQGLQFVICLICFVFFMLKYFEIFKIDSKLIKRIINKTIIFKVCLKPSELKLM